VLTKTDGDARGGAALSVRQITGKPIKFMGSGEKIDALQAFHPERVASRILGMGDVLSLVEEVQRTVDQQQAEKLTRKLKRGKGFSLEDFRSQLVQMLSMGGIGGLMDKLPGAAKLPDAVKNKVDDRQTRQLIAIIDSMTPHERRFPDLIRGSRKKRIAAGSGTSIQEVNRMLKQFSQMQKMMKKFGKGGMGKMMRQLGQLQGQVPPGFRR
jgi:signal recognition particle subunit SRP54